MTECRRYCQYAGCGKLLITQRADAKFCGKDCRNAHGNEQRRKDASTDKRLTAASGGEGSRGGNLRSIQQARDLQSEQKPKRDWSGAIDERIRRTLIETGYFHADDLDVLEVPPEHANTKGQRVGWFARKGLMEHTGQVRRVSHAAANARKAPIYRITTKGRAQLVGSSSGNHSARDGGASPGALARATSGEKGLGGAGAREPQGPGGSHLAPSCAGTGSLDDSEGTLFDLEQARERPRSAITDPRAA